MNKPALRNAVLDHLRRELATQTQAAELARDEAISEESRAENKWDTHSQEAAYLAEGQARLAAEISRSIEIYSTLPLPAFQPGDPVAIGAIIGIGRPAAPGATSWFFLGPRAGGIEVPLNGRTILLVTPQSPLGRQLLGKRVGDAVMLPGRAGPAQILSLS